LEDLKNYAKTVYDEVYPEDAGISDVTDRRNSLNRFISYHLINKRLSVSGLIDKYNMYSNSHMIDKAGLNIYEYIETMCPGTLIEVTRKGGTNETNLINRIPETDKSVTVLLSNSDKDATNGVYHQLTGILTYNKEFHNVISSKRLRFDAASFFPELTNNDMRGKGNTAPNSQFLLPKGYVERISCSDETVVGYLTPYTKYQDYQGDEIFLNATSGKLYNFTITTPPIPAGNYEVRFGYLTNGKRGVAQLYFDDVPCGVPLNMNTYATNISIGYESPGTNAADPNGYENDKMMRNRGFMKGPACFKVVVTGWSSGQNARYSSAALRKIIGIYTFPTATNHKFMVKGLSTGEFMFDYMEFIPTSAIEAEDIY